MNQAIIDRVFKSEGITIVSEYKFHPVRKFRFDYAVVEYKIALEVEGGIFTRGAHGSISGILRDIEKYNEATALGWRIIRVLPNKLLSKSTFDLLNKVIEICKNEKNTTEKKN